MEYPVPDVWNKLTEPNSMELPLPDLWNKLTEPNSMTSTVLSKGLKMSFIKLDFSNQISLIVICEEEK